MTADVLVLRTESLLVAQRFLDEAMIVFDEGEVAPELEMISLTGIATEVATHLRSIEIAREALVAAAKASGQALREILVESSALDGKIVGLIDASQFNSMGKAA